MRRKSAAETEQFQYDVCLSFAGEDRPYVERVARILRDRGVRVFYDAYEQVELWGKDLYTHLNDIYSSAARYCILFVSAHYARKVWTNHERAAAQERALTEHREYVLPVRFDHTSIPGLRRTIGYLDIAAITPKQLAALIIKKLGRRQRSAFLPPIPDLLLRSYVKEYGPTDPAFIYETAAHLLEALQRTTAEERDLILYIFQHTCPNGPPHNVHMNSDFLRRLTGYSEGKLLRTFTGMRSLGFYTNSYTQAPDPAHLGEDRIIAIEWHDMHRDQDDDRNATDVAHHMLSVTDFAHCEECALAALRRLDFSHLATSTLTGAATDAQTGRRIPHIGKELRKIHPITVEEARPTRRRTAAPGTARNKKKLENSKRSE